jgi:DNA-binding NarL/FixJ family response regulator
LTYRVLVVDDYERWRRHIGSVLERDPRWRIVGEASDGFEAVERALALRPDLILLDVDLPNLSGIDAARRIHTVVPGCRVLFLSEHRSWDIVEAALATNAPGYVVKSDAGRELLPAMEAIVEGRQFISVSVADHAAVKTPHERVAQKSRRHEAAVHTDEVSLVREYAAFAGSALDAGHAVVLVASGPRRQEIDQRLRASGVDVDRALEDGRYLPTDLEDMLSTFIVEGRLDEARFLNTATTLLMKASKASDGALRRVAACGDATATVWRQGNASAAIRLEQLWDQFARTWNVDIFCGYATPEPGHDEESFRRICALHSAVHAR